MAATSVLLKGQPAVAKTLLEDCPLQQAHELLAPSLAALDVMAGSEHSHSFSKCTFVLEHEISCRSEHAMSVCVCLSV